jgi:hypothetical protein
MTSRRWLALTVSTILIVFCANFAGAYFFDVCGYFRNPRGRLISVLEPSSDRAMKFLLSKHYVPANFDGLVIGASNVINFPMNELKGYRFYNESVTGADATEERRLVEQTLGEGHFKIALVVLAPTFTSTHDFHQGLESVSPGMLLGSFDSLRWESYRIHATSDRDSLLYPDGSRDMCSAYIADPKKLDLPVDRQSLADLRALVEELIAHGLKIVYVVPPVQGLSWQVNHNLFTDYVETRKKDLPSAPIIDLTGEEYEWFRADTSNFCDGPHVTPKGAEKITAILNDRLHAIPNL